MGDYGGSSSSSAGSATAAELHMKMSKKIAQLTKVIFHLNTRNEDFQFEFAHLKHVHVIEQQQLTADAAAKLQRLSEQLQTHRDADARAARDKQQLLQDLAMCQQQAAAQQQQTQQAFQRRVQTLEEQVETNRSAFLERVQQLTLMAETQQRAQQSQSSATTLASQAAHRNEINELHQKHTEEVEQVVMSSNARFTQMLGEQLKLQDALRADLVNQRAQWEIASTIQQRTQQTQWQQERDETQRTHDETKQQLVSKMEQLLTDAESLRGHETRLRADKEELQKTQGELQRQLKMLELQVSKAQHETQGVRKDSDANAQKLLQTLATSNDKLTQLTAELETLKKALADRDAALQLTTKARDGLQLELLKGSASLSENLAQHAHQLSERDLRLANLQVELTKQQQTTANAALTIKKLQAVEVRFAELSRDMDELQKKLASAELLRTTMQKEKDKMQSELNAKVEQADTTIVSLRTDHAKALEALKREHIHMVEALKKSHAEAMETLQRDADSRVRDVETKLTQHSSASIEKALGDAKQQHTQALAQLRTAADASEVKWNQEKAERATLIQKLQTDLALQAKEAADAHAKAAELVRKLTTCEEQLSQAVREKESLQNAAHKTQKDRDAASQKQLKDLTAQNESVIKRLTSEKERLVADHKQTQLQLTRDHADTLSAAQSAWETDQQTRLATQHETLCALYNQQLVDLKAQLVSQHERAEEAELLARDQMQRLEASRSSDMESFHAEISRLTDMAEHRLADLERTHHAAMETAVVSHAHELDRLTANHKREMDEMMSLSTYQAEQKHTQLVTQHAVALETLRQTHATAMRSLQETEQTQRHSEALALRAEMAHKLKELRSQKDAEHVRFMGDAATVHAAQVDVLQQDGAALSTALAERSSQLDASKRECESLLQALATTTRELHDRIATLERLNRDEVETLKRAAKRDLDRVLEENLAETKQLSDEFEETRQLMGESVAALQRAVAEWEAKYLRRESRPDDLARIALLEQYGVEKDALVRKTLDEMAYFKRELLNREEMYNKTFARAPNVGVLQVLKPHVLLQAQMMHQTHQMNQTSSSNTNGGQPVSTPVPMPPPVSQQSARHSKTHKPEELRRRSSERGTVTGASVAKKSLPPLSSSNNNQALGL